MNFIVKLLISIGIIIFCTQIGKRYPTLGGLVATMPLTGAIVLVWLYSDHPEDYELITSYTKGALWGILPSIMFFLVVFFCFSKRLPLSVVLPAGFGVWLLGAFIHQWLLR